MDHKTFTTTMAYNEVGAKRRKAAVVTITPRRLGFLGNVVDVNRERDGMVAKRFDLKVQLERATVINAAQHMIDHLQPRIEHCDVIIDGIDKYLRELPEPERQTINDGLDAMADIRRRATTPRRIDLRAHLPGAWPP